MCHVITKFEDITFKGFELEHTYFWKFVVFLYLPFMFIFMLSTELISPQMHIKDPFPFCSHLEIHIPEPLQLCFFHLLLKEIKRKPITQVSLRIITYFVSVSQSVLTTPAATTTKSERTT